MTPDLERQVDRYAAQIVCAGLNLQTGQRLLISGGGGIFGAPLEAAPLVRAVAAHAYRAGAPFVDVIWDDPALQRVRFEQAPRDSFDEFSTWRPRAVQDAIERGDALLNLSGVDPDLLAGLDAALVGQARQATYRHYAPVQKLIRFNATNWVVAGAATPGWAAKVLPDAPADERVDRLWEIILRMAHADGEDPVAAWEAHVERLGERAAFLNQRRYTALRFRAPGTDLSVGLPEGHIWHSGGLKNQRGVFFTANIPTEEVFTLPHRERVEGTVRATRPLSIGGALVEDFSLTFESGRVVGAEAARGGEHLQNLLDTDEGARRLGEVSLVPDSSPISQSGLIFYNILFDENASDHLALGGAYRFNLEGGQGMSDEEFEAAGGNQSLVHVDFMFGSNAMDVDGIGADGGAEAVMRGGEWAIG